MKQKRFRNFLSALLSSGAPAKLFYVFLALNFLSARIFAETNDVWRPVAGTMLTREGTMVSTTNVHPEYPRPQLVRSNWLNLNGLWDYAVTGLTNGAPEKFDGKILVPFPVESGLSGVGKRLRETNILWYRRQIHLPEKWSEQSVLLHFGAVDWHARVFVNGREAGQHRGGYDAFTLDISPYLNRSGNEEIVVAVQDPTEGEQPRGKQSRNPEGIFYTPSSGIWQTVWLEPVPRAHIERLRMLPDISRGVLRLSVFANRIGENLRVEAVALVDGKPVAEVNGAANAELEMSFENPRLWTPQNPFLYTLEVKLFRGEHFLDSVQSYCGLRELTVRKDDTGTPRLALNGEFLFQVGVLDQGFWPDGLYTAPSDAAWQSDLALVKKLGFNTVRKHVKVEAERWYYWCDRMGLLVWQDMPSGNNLTANARRQFEIELQRLVEGRGNHPSLVLWILFNEGWGQYDTARLTSWLKTLDPSRLVNSASGWIDKRVGDIVDVHSYPGPEAPGSEIVRAAVLGEFGGVGCGVEGHLWSPKTWSYEVAENSEQFTERYVDLLKQAWSISDPVGLSGVIYTQLSDVETESNGLQTYDRAVVKIDLAEAYSANSGEYRERHSTLLASTALHGRAFWRYTTTKPRPRWNRFGFNVGSWKLGQAGFGSDNFERLGTPWTTSEIWLRRQFVIPSLDTLHLKIFVRHAGDAEIFLNGVLAAQLTGESEGYLSVPLSRAAREALRPGLNLLAVHAEGNGSSQYLDAGIISAPEEDDSAP